MTNFVLCTTKLPQELLTRACHAHVSKNSNKEEVFEEME